MGCAVVGVVAGGAGVVVGRVGVAALVVGAVEDGAEETAGAV